MYPGVKRLVYIYVHTASNLEPNYDSKAEVSIYFVLDSDEQIIKGLMSKLPEAIVDRPKRVPTGLEYLERFKSALQEALDSPNTTISVPSATQTREPSTLSVYRAIVGLQLNTNQGYARVIYQRWKDVPRDIVLNSNQVIGLITELIKAIEADNSN